MSNRNYIVGVDENGQPYISHIGTNSNVARKSFSGKSRGNHRYIAKIENNGRARYFYTQEELRAYQKEKNGNNRSLKRSDGAPNKNGINVNNRNGKHYSPQQKTTGQQKTTTPQKSNVTLGNIVKNIAKNEGYRLDYKFDQGKKFLNEAWDTTKKETGRKVNDAYNRAKDYFTDEANKAKDSAKRYVNEQVNNAREATDRTVQKAKNKAHETATGVANNVWEDIRDINERSGITVEKAKGAVRSAANNAMERDRKRAEERAKPVLDAADAVKKLGSDTLGEIRKEYEDLQDRRQVRAKEVNDRIDARRERFNDTVSSAKSLLEQAQKDAERRIAEQRNQYNNPAEINVVEPLSKPKSKKKKRVHILDD